MDKYLLSACDKFWHESCLKCDRCEAKLGELGSSLYCKSSMVLCRQDYLEIFGQTAICSVCEKLIYASEMVMRAKQNVYHLECFACQLCGQRFCVEDRFYLFENKIVCQYDFEEHISPIQKSLLADKRVLRSDEGHLDLGTSTIQVQTGTTNLMNADFVGQSFAPADLPGSDLVGVEAAKGVNIPAAIGLNGTASRPANQQSSRDDAGDESGQNVDENGRPEETIGPETTAAMIERPSESEDATKGLTELGAHKAPRSSIGTWRGAVGLENDDSS